MAYITIDKLNYCNKNMAEVKILVVGRHQADDDRLIIGATVTLIKSDKNIIVDPGYLVDQKQVLLELAKNNLKPEDIDISVTNDMVTIRGRRMPEEDIKSPDYYHQELYWGPFSRSIILPIEVDSDKSKAAVRNGILTIRLPRLDKVRTKKIKISE